MFVSVLDGCVSNSHFIWLKWTTRGPWMRRVWSNPEAETVIRAETLCCFTLLSLIPFHPIYIRITVSSSSRSKQMHAMSILWSLRRLSWLCIRNDFLWWKWKSNIQSITFMSRCYYSSVPDPCLRLLGQLFQAFLYLYMVSPGFVLI